MWAALAEVDGPWWGVRLDVAAGLVAREVRGLGSGELRPLSEFLPEWRRGSDDGPDVLLDYADGINALRGAIG